MVRFQIMVDIFELGSSWLYCGNTLFKPRSWCVKICDFFYSDKSEKNGDNDNGDSKNHAGEDFKE